MFYKCKGVPYLVINFPKAIWGPYHIFTNLSQANYLIFMSIITRCMQVQQRKRRALRDIIE
jgi:hypothetical protein